MDLDDEERLRNVFWADARSRAACKEFGDVVTFDTTYLVNKYDMPFAPFVSVNHHVYDSLTKDEFKDAWGVFIKKYKLEDNEWLHGLYLERNRWVPAFVKDVFWAGMSSTQRSESMNHYFDDYINSKTTLKQFVEQYENTLAKKVDNEKNEDMKSSQSYIPCIVEDELEKQFQSAYTNAKVKEFQNEFVGKLNCSLHETKASDVWLEYEVKKWITFGEEKRKKRVSFTVNFNGETNEANCNCRLFEFRGMVCRHQLMVFHERGVERVPDKYVFRRWRKDVKRVHTKVRIKYDNSSSTIEARRHDNMCNISNEVADLAEDSQEKYDKVMAQLLELKRELIESSIVCASNMTSGTPNNSFSIGDEILPSKETMNILDPVQLHRKGRPPTKRKEDFVEKVVKKKRETQKKTLSKEKPKEAGTQERLGHNNCQFREVRIQESVININLLKLHRAINVAKYDAS
ncbi:hypothetical protein RHMOL_Rhmol06G0045800 [Rhododendron molle]|uniref:Uncharacterized protein n=1 Tax=Rhododendron molle TaxID=49168 RepID=A0ACC0NAU0_RHOML|nr:hypothetical protein RHMOL_Rhmol06G0045800 [Rhododendron molle]